MLQFLTEGVKIVLELKRNEVENNTSVVNSSVAVLLKLFVFTAITTYILLLYLMSSVFIHSGESCKVKTQIA